MSRGGGIRQNSKALKGFRDWYEETVMERREWMDDMRDKFKAGVEAIPGESIFMSWRK